MTELKPGQRATVRFAPPAGTVKVIASAVQVGLGRPTGKPSADPDKPDIGVTLKQNVDVQASLFPPGASTAAKSKTFKFRDVFNDPAQAPLELGVRSEQARREWRCDFKNTGRTTAKVGGSVRVVPPPAVPDEPEPAEVSIDSRASLPVTFLRPGDSTVLKFKPAAGSIDVVVTGVEVQLGRPTGKVDPNPDDGGDGPGLRLPQDVTVGVALRTGGKSVASATFRSRDALNDSTSSVIRTAVSAGLAGDVWECRLSNRSKEAIRCSARVSFLDEGIRTELPLTLLNHGLRQLIAAIGLTARIDGRRLTVGVSEELREFAAGLGAESVDLSTELPADVQDVNLHMVGLNAGVAGGRPVIRAATRFEATGEEIVDDFVHFQWNVLPVPVDKVDIGRLAITIDITLQPVGDPGRRSIVAIPEVEVDAAAFAEIVEIIGLDRSDDLRSRIESAINDVVDSDGFREAVRDFLADGLVHLAHQGHEFVDLQVDDGAWVVVHRDPDPDGEPQPTQPPQVSFPRPADVQPAAADAAAARLDRIDHLVVLMQENRSFDHVLGYLSHPDHGLGRLRRAGRDVPDGLTGAESNPLRPNSPAVNVAPYPAEVDLFDGRRAVPGTAVPFDPHHDHEPVVNQIAEGAMTGFARDFAERYPNVDPQLAMSFFTDEHVPVFDELAARYAICDRWFCSHPGPTQPNRFCTLSGHTPVLGNFDLDDPVLAYLQMPTIFDVLTEAGVDWVYFEGDVGFLRMYDRYRLDARQVVPYGDPQQGFKRRAELGLLPAVTFIDPNFADIPPAATANDDHPPADVRLGQRLIAEVHDALRSSPTWVTDDGGGTLLVVTYDEHGGFFDHVGPPGTRDSELPDPVPLVHPEGETFLGPRVPTLAIGPFVRPGSVDHTVYDHTSIIATILRRFVGEFPAELGPRPALANHLGHVLTLDEPRPTEPIGPVPLPSELGGYRDLRPDRRSFHAAMRSLALPLRGR
jgi:phospholipase C